mgnify:CR=1 FL=1
MSEHGNLNDMLFQRDFLQGYVNDYVSKGFRLAKFFTPQETDADTFTKIKDEMTVDEAIESGRMHKPRPMVKNADIEMIADEFYQTETGYIRSIGYGIQVNEKLMKRDPTQVYTTLNRISKLSYLIALGVETTCYDSMVESAGIIRGSGERLDGVGHLIGTGVDQKALTDTIVDYGVAFDYDDIADQELAYIIGRKNVLADIRKKLNSNEIVVNNDYTKIQGWTPDTSFSYAGVNFNVGSKTMGSNEVFGVGTNAKLGNIFYVTEKGAFKPSIKIGEGANAYAPYINVTLEEPKRKEMKDVWTIRMKANVGVNIDNPKGLLYDNDIKQDSS